LPDAEGTKFLHLRYVCHRFYFAEKKPAPGKQAKKIVIIYSIAEVTAGSVNKTVHNPAVI